jgi:predicted TIM-barrel fold metal-dependent hydrolase
MSKPIIPALASDPKQAVHLSLATASRRQFLTGLAALGAAAVIPQSGSLILGARAQTSTARTKPRRIDVHHHPSLPRSASSASAPAQRTFSTGPAPAVWTPDSAIAMMDEGGTDLTILSSGGNDGPMCRAYNDYMAKLRSDYPGRFGMFASVPFPDIDGSLKEIEYAMDTLKADGIRLGTSYGNKWLGDPAFAPIFEEMNRRKGVIYTHPGAPQCCSRLVEGIADPTIEFGTDTTRAIVRMVFSGSSARYPDMRMIFSHAGGTMPFLIVRLIKDSGAVPNGFPAEAGRFYYDTAQAAGVAAMSALKAVVPMSHILFGTDYPYITTAATAKGLKDSGVFSAKELLMIDRDNTLQLLPKYAT